ncbi:toxin-antitoxin system YwqK family antitoxin [Fusobacterium simiae]|uniref:Toxin-antitoxin system YwqK family antitoxin n=1 Tax=Fusobacterium simiae TaxID=855 RepID=A0ABT4DEW8_FUSSI|nr:toxin-antitoxin system YwqK family antitoxin [Fusobacterium simiae]MCY7007145.1 toxin-antitoxin system YwqK family antitoxin [Fusobacterium simiae]
MKKNLKILLLIMGALTLFSACTSVYTREEEYARATAIVLSKSMSSTTSFEKKWKTTNKDAIVDTFKNGEKDGEFRRYYLNGNLLMRGYCKEGRTDGIWEDYYPNGKILMSGYMKNNKRIGNWKYYDESGKLLGEVPYDQIPKEIRDVREKNVDQFWKDIKSGK